MATEEHRLYMELIAFIRNATEAISNGTRPAIAKTFQLVDDIITDFNRSNDLMEYAINYYDPRDIYLSHSANVAIISLKIASGMQLPMADVQNIVASAILHDIGFGKLVVSLLTYEDFSLNARLTNKEISQVKLHPKFGFDGLKDKGDRANLLAEIILQHHERADGTGYPNQIPGHEQHIPAQILSVADTYETLIHPRPYRDALAPPEGINAIVNQGGTAFSKNIVKTLIRALSIYPVGQIVRLNNGMVGKVVKTYEQNPVRPDLAIFFDATGKRLESSIRLKLSDEPLLTVEECIPGHQ